MSYEQLQGSGASGPIIDNTTPVERAMLFLVENGCNNLTRDLRPIDNHITPTAYGGACDVYKWGLLTGDSTYTDFPVAIKTLRCSSAFNHEARLPKRASRELITWLRFSHHPNILPLLGSVIFNGRLSMVSPWMSNGNLSNYLHKNDISSTGRIAFCEQIRDGLVCMHSMGVAHGDMKPANVMVSDLGVAMIADFGNTFFKDLALSFAPTSTFPVTYQYAPPEHLLATPTAGTEQSDVYSYGMTVLVRTIQFGEVPFSGQSNNWILLQAMQGVLSPARPNNIGDYIWFMLVPCWDPDPSKRPSLSTLRFLNFNTETNLTLQLSSSQDIQQQLVPSYNSSSSPSSSLSFDPVKYPACDPPLRIQPYVPQSSPFLAPGGANLPHVSYGSTPLEPRWFKPLRLPARIIDGLPPSPTTSSDEDEMLLPTDYNDSEGREVVNIICGVPVRHSDIQDNSLAFVLLSYAQWINFIAFDPLRIVGAMRNSIIQQFSSSEAARARIITFANFIATLLISDEPLDDTPRSRCLGELLTAGAHRAIIHFQKKEPDLDYENDMNNASKALDLMMEIILMKRFTSPLATVITLMESAAPVFRRACPDSPKQLVNLPEVLLSGNINLQIFVVTDVLLSMTMARPMLFKYNTGYTPDTYHRMMSGECGFEWLYGIHDQFIVLFAWINSLAEGYGPNVDPQYVVQIEEAIREVKTRVPSVLGVPGVDPLRTIRRTLVQECWRQTAYVYLYLVLCGVRGDDCRVTKAVKLFVRLVKGVNAGRNPDFFLFYPMITIGAFLQKERDRELIRSRLLGLRECLFPGVAGNVSLRALIEVWKRADTEQQAPKWSHLTVAYCRLIDVS